MDLSALAAMTDVIAMSISSSALIGIIIIIRKLLFKSISKRTLTALWIIAAVKLLVPFNLYNVITVFSTTYPDRELTFEAVESVESRAVFTNQLCFKLTLRVPEFLGCVWLFGAVFIAAYVFFVHIKNRRRFACALPFGYDISELKESFGIKRRVRIKISDRTDASFTYGVFAPVIILPKSMVCGTESVNVENVLCHELAHIKRFDVLFRTAAAVCTAVHWFNPLVWAMTTLAARDAELACDEIALRIGKASPEDYAMTLIGMEERRSFVTAAGFAGGVLEERITEIMRKKKSSRASAAGLTAAVLSLAGAVFINAAVILNNGSAETETFTEAETYAVEDTVMEAVSVSYDSAEEISDVEYEYTFAEYASEEISQADFFTAKVYDGNASAAEYEYPVCVITAVCGEETISVTADESPRYYKSLESIPQIAQSDFS